MPRHTLTRREFIGHTSSCAAHIGLMAAAAPSLARLRWSAQERFPVVAAEPWGRLLQVAEGIWALVSDPLVDRTTLCNGGIIAGRAGVVLVESFATIEGAVWMAGQARRLTGRDPTHTVLTHYHADHTGGLAATVARTRVLATDLTRDLIRERNAGAPEEVLDAVLILGRPRATEIDLGDRSVLVVPRRGHTDSDVSVEVPEASVVFAGDLIWNAMFPNYVDALPSRLSREVRVMQLLGAQTYVPGHGPLADGTAVERYMALLDSVEEAARDAVARGLSAEEGGAAYRLPTGLEGWTRFDPSYFARAIDSWMGELRPAE